MTRVDAGFEGPTADTGAEAIANQDQIFADTFPGMLGVRMLTAGIDGATATVEVGPSVRHPGGYAHGGAIAGFGDTIAAWATFPHLAPGESFTTIEFKANFITGVANGVIHGRATVAHRGRRTMVVEVRMTAGDKLVALMTVTQAVLSPRSGATPDAGIGVVEAPGEVPPE